ncbi:RNA polymerase sporulation sigma factor SigH [Alkalibaculum bacchi]|uniref:RNA polymerase sporulation sigma factor SigH n=1 Tax=Alkalibaculum bacchi TaxID=645887 RepID=UPI0026F014DC|nr:RNA polymerase sporulation sigma factor SigH [Alkalibaculum bacchi]
MNANLLQVENVLSNYPDEKLALMSREGDREAEELLFERYRNFVKVKTSSFFLVGADKEDIIQEGMIGLFKSIRDFNPERCVSFRAFAELCIQRQIISAVKASTRQKHNPLNSSISLDMPIYNEKSHMSLIDAIINEQDAGPEAIIIGREQAGDIEEKIYKVLSELERTVLLSYINGKSYYEIARDLDKQVKCIDNALQRVKRKLENYLKETLIEDMHT